MIDASLTSLGLLVTVCTVAAALILGTVSEAAPTKEDRQFVYMRGGAVVGGMLVISIILQVAS